jgi:signal transduction histidine kinase/CheY-like chemotaxis protein
MNSIQTSHQLIEQLEIICRNTDDSVEAKNLIQLLKLALAKDETNYNSLINKMEEGIAHCEIICDVKGEPINYRFLSVNNAFEKQSGITPEAILGKTILDVYPEAEKSWIQFYGEVALSLEAKTTTKYNPKTKKYFTSSAYSTHKGEFTMLFKDVTDQENKRITLEKAYQKAEENDRLKSAFLANISHEVRTPMNAILGFASLLENDGISQADKKLCLQLIKSSCSGLLAVISDIVDISKIDAEQQKLVFKKCDLNQLIDDLLNRYSVLNTNSEIELKAEKGSITDTFFIKTDEIRLDQILSNLIENALKFTQKGEVIFGYELSNDHLHFYVKDTGIGIEKKDQQVVFERFGQIENKTKKISSGTGLGLPIAKAFVELFKGEIWFQSKLNMGTTFHFKIPHNKQDDPKSLEVHQQTILIAEDDDVNFLLLNLWLKNDFNVIRATNGFEAIHLFEKYDTIDLVLMDIKMPYLNGIEATKAIRKTDIYIPIIAHTAYAMNEESVAIKMAGCNEILIKPLLKEDLLKAFARYNVTAKIG